MQGGRGGACAGRELRKRILGALTGMADEAAPPLPELLH